jgi:hypothetical protein
MPIEIPRFPSEKNTIISSSEFTVWRHSTIAFNNANVVTTENAIERSTMKNKFLFEISY